MITTLFDRRIFYSMSIFKKFVFHLNSFFFKGEKYVEDYLLDCTSDIPWSRGKRA